MSTMLSRSSLGTCRNILSRSSLQTVYQHLARASTTATDPETAKTEETPRKRKIPIDHVFADLLAGTHKTSPHNGNYGNNKRYAPVPDSVGLSSLADDEFDGKLGNGLAHRLALRRKRQLPMATTHRENFPEAQGQVHLLPIALNVPKSETSSLRPQRKQNFNLSDRSREGMAKLERPAVNQRAFQRENRFEGTQSVSASGAVSAHVRRGDWKVGARQEQRGTRQSLGAHLEKQSTLHKKSLRDKRPSATKAVSSPLEKVSNVAEGEEQDVSAKGELLPLPPPPEVMGSTDLDKLFETTVATPSTQGLSISMLSGVPIAAASPEPEVNLTSSQLERMRQTLEEAGGKYDRYLPPKLHVVSKNAPHKSGALLYAHLALSRRPDVSLVKKKRTLNIITRLIDEPGSPATSARA